MSDPFEQRLRGIVAALSYKDWRFHIAKDGIGLWFMQVHADDSDATNGRPLHWHGRKWRISMHMTDGEMVQTALKAVLTAEEHEARERFLYLGRAIFGPHLSVAQLWELAGQSDAKDQRA